VTYADHMIEHVVLAQIVPLLLLQRRSLRRSPDMPAMMSWLVGVATMVVASLPAVFSVAQHDAGALWTIRAALVISGVLFWRPVRATTSTLSGPMRILYLVCACFVTTLAGAGIAFGAATTDRQIGGLVMWVPCCLIYLSVVLAIVARALRGSMPIASPRQHVTSSSMEWSSHATTTARNSSAPDVYAGGRRTRGHAPCLGRRQLRCADRSGRRAARAGPRAVVRGDSS